MAESESTDEPTSEWITVQGFVFPTPLGPSPDPAAVLEQLTQLLDDPALPPEARSFIEEFLRSARPSP